MTTGAPREYPASFAQERMWFLEQLDTAQSHYGMSRVWRLRGHLDCDALSASVEALTARHEILRTTFRMRPDGLRQVVRDDAVTLEVVPVSEALLDASVRDMTSRRFDLAVGPLAQFRLLRHSDEHYVLAILLHHIVCDGWGLDVMLRELSEQYAARVQGCEPALPPLPMQYGDYAAQQREAWASGRLNTDLAFWRRELDGAPTVVNLPADRPRPAVRSGRGARERLTVPAGITRRLRATAQRTRTTLFMVLVTAFHALLSRYSGQRDIVVGTPVAGRARQATEPLVGLFVNTLPVRATLAGDPPFDALLQQVRERLSESYMHQDVPFEKLVAELQIERSTAHAPLVQVMCALQNTPKTLFALPGIRIERIDVPLEVARLDLTLALEEVGDALAGRIDYDRDLFDPGTISRLADHYVRLLDGIATDHRRRVLALPLLSEAERTHLRHATHGARVTLPEAAGIHDVIAAQAARTPARPALACDDACLTYGEMNARANQLARFLQRHGVGPDVTVAICLERGVDVIVALLAVLKAGGAYVPLESTFPRERLAFMIADSRSRVVITRSRLRTPLPGSIETICLDEAAADIARQAAAEPKSDVRPAHLAYVIYTSGSCGRPKGVAVEHRQILNYVAAVTRDLAFPSGPLALASTIAADLGHTMLFPALCHGNTLHVLPDGVIRDGHEWRRYFDRHGIAGLKITPTHLRALLGPARDASALPSCQLVIGGEASTWDWIAELERASPECRIFNHYGPTECTVGAVACELSAIEERHGLVPLGTPLANTTVYVLDDAAELSPTSVPGELYIGGDGVARGYLGQPSLTAERFLPDPFASTPGARLYRTGDRVRWRSDRRLEFLGRVDEELKVRGFRVHPREIESTLRQHAHLNDALVTAHMVDGRQELAAYVVAGAHAPMSEESLRAWLAARLPDHMVPATVTLLPAWPLTANGKLDRRALPVPEPRARRERAYDPPRTPVEAILADIWQDVLGLPRVGIYDNFFELGGDSIHSIQVITRAAQRGLELVPRDAFEHQTVAALAAGLRPRPAIRIEDAPLSGIVPLTPVQRWFFAQDLACPHHYNQSLLLEPRETLDADVLRRAFDAVYRHHDAFGMRYERDGSVWRQCARLDHGVAPYEIVDLGRLPAAAQPNAVKSIAADRQSQLHIHTGPLARFTLFERGAGRPQRLLLIAHHLIVDGVSWRILAEDLDTAYRQLRHGDSVDLPPRTSSLCTWGAALDRYARSAEHVSEIPVWQESAWRGRQRMLPRDGPGGVNTEASARYVTVRLSVPETEQLLRDAPRAAHARVPEVLLAALWQAVAEWAGHEEFGVMLEGHGREVLEPGLDLSRTIGWFTATRPVRLDLRRAATAAQRLRTVRSELGRVAHGGIGYGCWRYPAASPGTAGVADAAPELTLNYLGQFDQTFGGHTLWRVVSEPQGPVHAPVNLRSRVLQINGRVLHGRLELSWTYSSHLHRRKTIARLAERHLTAVRSLVRECLASAAPASSDVDPDVTDHDLLTISRALGR